MEVEEPSEAPPAAIQVPMEQQMGRDSGLLGLGRYQKAGLVCRPLAICGKAAPSTPFPEDLRQPRLSAECEALHAQLPGAADLQRHHTCSAT